MVVLAHDDGRAASRSRLSAMNVIGTQAISHHAPGPARSVAAVTGASAGGGFHNVGLILLALVVLGGLGFAVTRLRRGRHAAQHDDPWIGREPPPPPPSPSGPPGGFGAGPTHP
jgi:hypothetical protein